MKDLKIYLSVASALLIIYLVAEFNRPAPINWKPTFSYNDKIPFGTYIIYHQLKQVFPGAKVVQTGTSVYNTLHGAGAAAANYLIIAKTVKINKYDLDELTKYIRAGNSVFISCFNLTGALADTLKIGIDYEYQKGNASLNFTSNTLKQKPDYTFKRDISNQFFAEFDTARATVIGKNNYGHSTFISFNFGKGKLYLCANPCIFTNYGLLTPEGSSYAAKALSYLPAGKSVYWDEFQSGDTPGDESPMRVFFDHAALQWAYYLSLFGMLAFILYEIKRRQRVIPVIAPLKNTSVEFVNVVGQVYYEKRNNANIAHKKIIYLLAYLRDEHQLKTSKLDNEFIKKLTDKLAIETSLARDLVNHINYIDVQRHVTDHELILLNQLIEKIHTSVE